MPPASSLYLTKLVCSIWTNKFAKRGLEPLYSIRSTDIKQDDSRKKWRHPNVSFAQSDFVCLRKNQNKPQIERKWRLSALYRRTDRITQITALNAVTPPSHAERMAAASAPVLKMNRL